MPIYPVLLYLGKHKTHLGADFKGVGVEAVREWLHSDTLFSALCHGLAAAYGKKWVDDLTGRFFDQEEEPPFRLSSCFLSNYLPKPRLPIPGHDSEDPEVQELFRKYAHRIESVEFIDMERVKDWITWEDAKKERTDYSDLYNEIIEAHQRYRSAFVSFTRGSNELDRSDSASNPFDRGMVKYGENEALWFFLQGEKELIEERLMPAFADYLKTTGFGGERADGFGRIDRVSWDTIDAEYFFEDSAGASPAGYYLLSLYHPTEEELKRLKGSRYRLVTRKGWFHTPYSAYQFKRKACTMFGEGSVIGLERPPRGKLADVCPDGWWREKRRELGPDRWHHIYRFGIAMAAPVFYGKGL